MRLSYKAFAGLALASLIGFASKALGNAGNPTPWVPGPPPGANPVPCGAQQVPEFICNAATGICVSGSGPWCTQYCMPPSPPAQPTWSYRCKSPAVTGGW